jgi:hypothetical protein
MTISDESQQTDLFGTELDQTLLPEDFPARTSQRQESRQALTVSAVDSGPSLPVLLASYNPDTQSWKTSQTSLVATADDGLDEYSETWPRSGMTRNGIAYQLPRLAPTTTEIGSGYWRTPASANGNQGPKSKEFYDHCRKTGQSTVTLVDEVRHTPRHWPTPAASDYKGAPKNRYWGSDTYRSNLREAVRENQESGQLNPAWTEWLMGFPSGHTDLKH